MNERSQDAQRPEYHKGGRERNEPADENCQQGGRANRQHSAKQHPLCRGSVSEAEEIECPSKNISGGQKKQHEYDHRFRAFGQIGDHEIVHGRNSLDRTARNPTPKSIAQKNVRSTGILHGDSQVP
jgi:hypothetical protein